MVRTRVGYTGGSTPAPTYRSLGDHTEALQIDYDPSQTSYAAVLALFWGDDHPYRPAHRRQYRSAVFFADDAQRAVAEAARQEAERTTGLRAHAALEPLRAFHRAEDYHQKYALRRHKELLDELSRYDPRALADSTVAMRINAYAYGFGTAEELAAELPSLELSPEGARKLSEIVARSGGRR